ncbi:MAG TPA: aminotransferase class I/II-fold pyridoxal phosphate-dependent enzyme [Dehalococcoidia bacterium]|jgi:LL-diaminopimelate aminotransferase|nr:LL-diaminopimelate aminotransferase [Chloroflexota bacterium]HIB11045.1 aminotransferase class I/II-fold pyridoxal phosphate-dependent enzyme [Dehalococcoidia bacterium]HIM47683.1 aminotransferase class I/II-fold pyridoxal phosphate-dependent enzyme [Dehalococcoidia bacterium]|tara:strand:- start:1265 stop:2443 length:1179 start_codon:yes stop_codon:yes gene_type:complete
MKFSDRLGKLAPYPFVEISRIIAEKRAAGADVVTFGIGDPDIPTPQPIIDRLLDASQDPPNHRYPETDGLPEVRRAIAHWYEQRFGVQLDPDKEVLPLIGAKEGIGHAAFCFLDPGDVALIPDPAYPVYGVGTMFAGAESHIMPLYERNGWLPELDAIPGPVADAAKLMWLNYPNNPTSAVATHEDLAAAVAYCREKDIALLHDAAYSEVGYEGYRATSCMQVDGAKDVSLEFHSLSKTYNMTGWRIGMAVGNAEMIRALFQIKANLDSGIPQAIQQMAIEALTGSQDCVDSNVEIYQRRRDRVIKALRTLGLTVDVPRASLYIWARVPEGFTSAELAARLLEETDIVVTPGSSYGQYGEGYIRLSLTTPDEQVEKGCQRLESWKIPAPQGG